MQGKYWVKKNVEKDFWPISMFDVRKYKKDSILQKFAKVLKLRIELDFIDQGRTIVIFFLNNENKCK